MALFGKKKTTGYFGDEILGQNEQTVEETSGINEENTEVNDTAEIDASGDAVDNSYEDEITKNGDELFLQVQDEIFKEINDEENALFLKVRKKEPGYTRNEYLAKTKQRCEDAGLTDVQTEDIIESVDKMLWGFGIIDNLIADPDISDIRLIDENNIRIKKRGKRYGTKLKFLDYKSYIQFIDHITMRNQTNMSISNAAQVFTDKDSCKTDILRFSLVSQNLNTNGHPTLLIRKIPKQKKTFEKLLADKFATPEQVEFLKKRWSDGHSILVCGPNGSGKTTLVNAILDYTPHDRSCDVIQESEELYCDSHPEMLFRKIVQARNESAVKYDLRDVTRLALMESFDIIIIGEIKGNEAAQLGQATYTGSQAMTTVHSNSAPEALEKIIDYAMDAQQNMTREHFAKQIQSLDTLVFVKDYHIAQITINNGWNKKEQDFDLRDVTDAVNAGSALDDKGNVIVSYNAPQTEGI